MPVLDNARHEAFANGLAKQKTVDDAYASAGFKPNRGNASRLKANERIAARVVELQQMAAQGTVVDRQWVIAKLVENVDRSMQAQEIIIAGKPTGEYRYDGSVANKALELLGKEIGMFVEHVESVNTNYNISDQPLTEDEWADQHATQH